MIVINVWDQNSVQQEVRLYRSFSEPESGIKKMS